MNVSHPAFPRLARLTGAVMLLTGIVFLGYYGLQGAGVSFSQPLAASQGVQLLTPREAAQLIQTHAQERLKATGLVILDVRTPAEHNSGALPDSINLDFWADDFQTQLAQLDPSLTYLVYCQRGVRSHHSVRLMETMGFSSSYDLQGGLSRWRREGFPVTAPAP